MKILFVYPNKEGYPIIPLGISILAGVLRDAGHSVDLFDVTFMMKEKIDNASRVKASFVKDLDMELYWGSNNNNVDIQSELVSKLQEYQPDIVALSIVENNYICAKQLLGIIRRTTNSLTIVGGAFPTIAPEFFVNDSNVDVICLGEGEYALAEVANRLAKNKSLVGINNLFIRKEEVVTNSNGFSEFYTWEPNVYQNFEIFDKRHLLKPFMGEVVRTGFFEMSRGCPYKCTYCANSMYQKIFCNLKGYHREKPINYVIDEIEFMKNKYALELVFFNDETFMLMSKERFSRFSEEYTGRVNLPFFIQTRADTLLNLDRVKMLADAGCTMVGIGLESGNSDIRRKILGKEISNSSFVKAFQNCEKCSLNTTIYAMLGVPFETRADILSTIEFCKRLRPTMLSINIFAPYYGTELRKVCIENGFIEDKLYESMGMNCSSVLMMPQISKEEIDELFYSFSDKVYGKER